MVNNFSNFLLKRRSVTAKKMSPTIVKDEDLNSIISAGIRVPDHGALTPWRIIVFKDEEREKFGKDFLGKRFRVKNPNATEEERQLLELEVLLLIKCHQGDHQLSETPNQDHGRNPEVPVVLLSTLAR